MTEKEWLTNTKATIKVMKWLRQHGSERKFYLAAAAAVRHVWHLIDSPASRAAVEVVERFADGQASANDLEQAFLAASAVMASPRFLEPLPTAMRRQESAHNAAVYAAWSHAAGWGAAVNAMERATKTARRADIWPWQAAMLRDIFGNPFCPKPALDPAWLRWHDDTIPRLARQMYDSRDFASMPILADALEEAGCTSADILDHCRGPGPHVRGCWLVDLILDKQ